MWLLAGPIKCNWPSVTLWSVFQYPVTYLFKYTPETLEQIDMMQSKLGLHNGEYVSLHVRSHITDGFIPNPLHLKVPWSPMFECAIMAAQSLGNKLNISRVPIFLAADHQRVRNYAK